MKRIVILIAACIILVPSAFCWQEIILQEDFTPAQNGTLPAMLDSEWDAGIDVIVMPYSDISAPNPAPTDHPGGDGYALRIGDLQAGGGGYNFCFPSNYTTANATNCAVEAWIYCNLDPAVVTVEQDYGLFLRATPSTGGDKVYTDRKAYWLWITINSSWGTYIPANGRPFILTRPSAAWIQIGEGTGTYTTGWHKFRLEAVDSTIKGYIDDVLEISTTDSSLTSGFAGMVFYTSLDGSVADTHPFGGTFDNFKWIRNPTEPFVLDLAPTGPIALGMGQTRTFTATGGTNNFTWSLSTIGVCSISTTGGPSVLLTAIGAGTVDLKVSDPGLPLQEKTVTITVSPTSTPLFIDVDKVNMSRRELFE